MPLHFRKKEFEILDLGSPINDISHYGACTFEDNLALSTENEMIKNYTLKKIYEIFLFFSTQLYLDLKAELSLSNNSI